MFRRKRITLIVFLLGASIARGPVSVPAEAAVVNKTSEKAPAFLASPIEGVDWTAGKIRATGKGLPAADTANPTLSRETARRAALADAQRKLVQAIAQIKVAPDKNLESRMSERNFTEKIEGFVRGYTVTAEREFDGGRIEVDVELPLNGPGGLSRYLAD